MSLALATGLAVFVSPCVAAAGTLDQSQTTFNGSLEFGEERYVAQTFTAGLDGGIDQVDLYVRFVEPFGTTCSRGSGITVEIRTAAADVPTDTTLATANIPALSISTEFGFLAAMFAPPAAVSAGTQYALVLSAPDANCEEFNFPFSWGGGISNPYAAGRGLVRIDAGSSWLAQGNYDNAFRTFVATTLTQAPQLTPGPPGTPAPPPTRESARTLTISYSQKKEAFHGKLASQASACVSSQKVTVFEQKKGRDSRLGSSTTRANGRYSLKRERSEGRFYARVGRSTTSGGTCLATQSKQIKLNG